MILTLYLLALAALALHAPDVIFEPGALEFLILLGVIGAWRYSWSAVHLARALLYRQVVFPKWRRQADALGDAGLASHVYIIITSYRVRPETTTRVYQAAIAEAIRYGRPATIIAGLVEIGDQRLIKRVFQQMRPPPEVRLVFVRRPPTGKRSNMATCLRAVSRLGVPPGAALLVVDGDTLLGPGTLARSLPFLRLMPDADGITTDEDALVDGGPLMQSWHSLRFAQRHQMMSSLGLSRRLLAMTGRTSIYRAEAAIDPGFIDAIENDHLDHWRLGRIRFLTGEDKSTWFWLLQRDRAMLYVPDVKLVTIEHPPSRRFLPGSTQLMLRWFGNMLRSGSRAIDLGPRRVGAFTWWCLIDQRISMWTPLIGPTVAILFVLAKSTAFLYAYLMWIGLTRLVQTLVLLTARPRISGLWPPLIYFGQVYGALVKTYILFRLDRQRWTRQNIATERGLTLGVRLQRLGSAYVHGLALCTLVAAVAFATDVLDLPPVRALTWPF